MKRKCSIRAARELQRDILELVRETHIDRELALGENLDSDADAALWLPRLDTYLCDLKESQIRDGLHIFGQSPQGRLRIDTLLALLRIPRGDGRGAQSSLLRALSKAFELDFDPLNCELAEPWTGPRPAALQALSSDPWRSAGDARERLELYAAILIGRVTQGEALTDLPAHDDLAQILDSLRDVVAPRLDACGPGEMQGMLDALSGRFVPAGPMAARRAGGAWMCCPLAATFYRGCAQPADHHGLANRLPVRQPVAGTTPAGPWRSPAPVGPVGVGHGDHAYRR